MKKKVVTVLLVIVIALILIVAAALGYLWYRENHIFIEGTPYNVNSTSLDLREEDISFSHYNSLHSQLPNCEILWNVPFQGGKVENTITSLAVTELTEEDAEILMVYFPNLRQLDATGCTDYALLESLAAQEPDWEITYEVDLGGSAYAPDTQALELSPGEYTYDTLLENLVHLPQVAEITLHMPEFGLEKLAALREAYPEVDIRCTVEILGTEYDTDTTELNLSAMTSDELTEVVEKLAMLPELEAIELMDGESSSLSIADVKALMEAVPDASIHYTFEFYGQALSTDQEEVEYKNQKMGDDAEEELRQVLDILPKCTRFVLDNCGFSDEVMDQVREDYRGRTKIVWRVWFGEGGSSLTDATAIRAVYGLVDDNCHDLVYCEDVVYMDIGHNEYLDACDFIAGMPNLEYVIVSGSPIKSLEPFAVCTKLKFLEAAFCEYLTDASPLSSCTSLEMLNISNTHITDLSPLDDLPLTHLCAKLDPTGVSRVSAEEQARFIEKHPDCWVSFTGSQPYGAGWRYTDDSNTEYLPYYQQIRDVFMYDKYPNCPNDVGWYYEEKTTWTVVPEEELAKQAGTAEDEAEAEVTAGSETTAAETAEDSEAESAEETAPQSAEETAATTPETTEAA